VDCRFTGLDRIQLDLETWSEQGKQRHLRRFASLEGVCLQDDVTGRRYTDFCGNDYLGLSQHPALIEASKKALETHPASTTSSRLIRGTFEAMAKLEDTVSRFVQAPAALVFNTGYQANVGLLSTVLSRHDRVFSDRLNHASLLDGLRLAGVKADRYAHADLDDLAQRLEQARQNSDAPLWVISESVFSMDGDCVDLARLLSLCQRYGAWLILDEAHGVGVYGERYRSGLLETLGLLSWPDNVILVGTFSKALGSYGAFVAGHPSVIQLLTNRSRSFIYSTSLPPSIVAANQAALDVLMEDASMTEQLWAHIRTLEQGLNAMGVFSNPIQVTSPICPILLGDNDRAMQVSRQLEEAGFYVQGIRPPTVPEGTARLRLTLSTLQTSEQIDALLRALAQALR
jgi:8-amino-7-oxononanoate synthase